MAHWLCKKILGVQRKRTEELYQDILDSATTLPNLDGVLFLDGNIAPDHFASFNACVHDRDSRTVYARVGGPNVFMFHGIKGFIANMMVRLGDFYYVVKFNEDYTEAEIRGRLAGISIPKRFFHGVILKTDTPHVYHRYNPDPDSSGNYTLRCIENRNGKTSQRERANEKLALHSHRWTGADGFALVDLPAAIVTRIVSLFKN